jgi:hypothetical protein
LSAAVAPVPAVLAADPLRSGRDAPAGFGAGVTGTGAGVGGGTGAGAGGGALASASFSSFTAKDNALNCFAVISVNAIIVSCAALTSSPRCASRPLHRRRVLRLLIGPRLHLTQRRAQFPARGADSGGHSAQVAIASIHRRRYPILAHLQVLDSREDPRGGVAVHVATGAHRRARAG